VLLFTPAVPGGQWSLSGPYRFMTATEPAVPIVYELVVPSAIGSCGVHAPRGGAVTPVDTAAACLNGNQLLCVQPTCAMVQE
jgi:hypothetical protein